MITIVETIASIAADVSLRCCVFMFFQNNGFNTHHARNYLGKFCFAMEKTKILT